LVGGRFRFGSTIRPPSETALELTYRFLDGPFALVASPWSYADGHVRYDQGDLIGLFPVYGLGLHRLELIAGYRILQLNSQFHMAPLVVGAQTIPGFDARDWHSTSQYHGALFGVRSGWSDGRFQFQWQVQASLGGTRNRTEGDEPSQQSRFAVVPDAELRLGYECWDGFRAYVGFDVIALGGLRGGESWGNPFASFRGDFSAAGFLFGIDWHY
jgi:hypothetical protein